MAGPSDRLDEYILEDGSSEKPTLSVILPTRNEAAGIAECIYRIKQAIAELEIRSEIIVSDSSGDDTPRIAAEMGARVVSPDRLGYGYAYRYAIPFARGEYVAMGDADTTYDFAELPTLYRELVETPADLVLGSRFEGHIRPGAMPFLHRYIGNPLLTDMLNRCYGVNVTDAHSGFRLLRRERLEQLDLDADGMEFASEMIVKASIRDWSVSEVPISYHPREGDSTLDSFRDGWSHLKLILRNSTRYNNRARSVLACGVGTFMIILSLVLSVVSAPQALIVSTMVVGGFSSIVSVQLVGLRPSGERQTTETLAGRTSTGKLDGFRLGRMAAVGTAGALVGIGVARWFVIDGAGAIEGVLTPLQIDILVLTLGIIGFQLLYFSLKSVPLAGMRGDRP